MRNLFFFAVTVLAVGLIGSAFSHAKQATRPKTPPPKPPPFTTKITLRDNGLVTASYLRMHHPEALLRLAKQVQAGKANQRTLDTVIARGLQPGVLAISSPKAPAGSQKFVIGKPQLAHTASKWGVIANTGVNLNLIDYSPTSLKFPDSWDQQTVTATLHVTSNTDGPVTAALGANSPFAIKSMTIYDGTITQHVGFGGQPIALRKVEAQVTHAPWSIDANAGQDVDIELSFSPKFNLNSFTAGVKKDTLAVKGSYWNPNDPVEKPWKLSVPVSGLFKGIQVDVIFEADEDNVTFITPPAYNPSVKQNFEITATLVNVGQDVNGTIVGNDLGPGLSMAPIPITLAKGKTMKTTLVFSIDPESTLYLTLPYGHQVPIGAKLELPGRSSTISMTMTPYDGIHEWDFLGSGAGVDFNADFWMYSSGDFTFNIEGYNNNWFWSDEVSVDGRFNGVQYINLAVTASNLSNFSDFYGFNRSQFKADYVGFLHTPLYMTVHINAD